MTLESFTTPSPYRTAGRAAIASGLIGIIAFACLFMAVSTRTTMILPQSVYLLFRAHDIGIILQFTLMILVVLAIHQLSLERAPGLSFSSLAIGVGAPTLIVIILLLVFPKLMPDDYYLVPEGLFGIWLIIANWRIKRIFSAGLCWFGVFVGIGLTLVGCFPLAYAIFVTPTIFHIPPVEQTTYIDTVANNLLHLMLDIGTLMGVLTLPIWTILTGRKLLKYNHETINSPRL
ncbi:hypothetical protein ACPPVU_09740 [Mucilaginibacter sp. McL0603]|uniref:hypothetical protein n=1 Tax=Mucilaginibacter sp. McL0603 TaxID=3415670 RepID=UPI003CF16A0C